jgi:hypothetical protein
MHQETPRRKKFPRLRPRTCEELTRSVDVVCRKFLGFNSISSASVFPSQESVNQRHGRSKIHPAVALSLVRYGNLGGA